VLAYVRALPDHRVIDRLIQSRGWIPVLGILLSGIVFMQVEVLKLNASMGRALTTSSALASRNELLRNAVSMESDDQRIETLAAKNGMYMPAPDAPSFLSSRASLRAALANIQAPDAATFAANNPPPPSTTPDTSGSTSTGVPLTTALPGVPASSSTDVAPVVPTTSSTSSSGG
jgi:hypothetical protein